MENLTSILIEQRLQYDALDKMIQDYFIRENTDEMTDEFVIEMLNSMARNEERNRILRKTLTDKHLGDRSSKPGAYTLRSTIDPIIHMFDGDDRSENLDQAFDAVMDYFTVVIPRESGQKRKDVEAVGFFAFEQDAVVSYPGIGFMVDGVVNLMHAGRLLDQFKDIRDKSQANANEHATMQINSYTAVAGDNVVNGIEAKTDDHAAHIAAALGLYKHPTDPEYLETELLPFAVYRESDGELVSFGVQCYLEVINEDEEFEKIGRVARPVGLDILDWFRMNEEQAD